MPTNALSSEKLDSRSFDELLKLQNPFEKTPCAFDLTGIRFISPAALVQLAAACCALKKKKHEPVIVIDDFSVGTYLARAGFIKILEPIARIEPSYFLDFDFDHLRGSNDQLIELTKIESGAELHSLLPQIINTLCNRLQFRTHDAYDVAVALSEICQNTFDHNKGACGFLAMQVYGQGTKRFLEIGVADYGDGLAKTLRRNSKHAKISSDLDAIELATKLGTSQYDDPTRGTGLYHLLEIAYKHEGSVQIRSGDGNVRYRMDKKAAWAISVTHMPGVQIALTLNAKKRS